MFHRLVCRASGYAGCGDQAPRDVDEALLDLSDRKPPHNGPIAQYY